MPKNALKLSTKVGENVEIDFFQLVISGLKLSTNVRKIFEIQVFQIIKAARMILCLSFKFEQKKS